MKKNKGLAMLVFGLIMLQPDFGTGAILVMAIVALLFIAGVNMKYFYILFAIGVVGSIGLIIIAPYRMSRITSFLNPWNDPLGSGFQIIQSLYAIGPGGLLGVGFLNSRQKHFYLPEPQTDFIFSIISEEFGILGIIMMYIIGFTHKTLDGWDGLKTEKELVQLVTHIDLKQYRLN